MPLFKLTSIFNLATVPVDPALAVSHVGGWTESVWTQLDVGAFWSKWNLLQRARASLLPASGNINGYRYTAYDIDKNFLMPRGTEAGKQNFPGVVGNPTDVPQMALDITGQTATINKSSMEMRGIPDDMIKGGEYAPSPGFKTSMDLYLRKLYAGDFGYVGRDMSQASVRVLGATIDGITVSAIPSTGLATGDWIRLNRVLDSQRVPISGAFRVVTYVAGPPAVITVANWKLGQIIIKPSGTLRRDQAVYLPFTDATVGRASVKKVGSPLEKYRGRRSRKRV